MPLGTALLPEFDEEMAKTRRSLERAPEEKFGWKPHPRSNTMGWLVGHLSGIPEWAVMTIRQDSLDLAPGGVRPPREPDPATRQEALDKFDKNVAAARIAIAEVTDEQLAEPWSLLMNGQALITLPRGTVLRSWVMNHNIHHRAQLGVYFRLNDVPVPAIYGPSADEQG